MTGVVSPPCTARLKMVLYPVLLWTILRISRGLTATLTGSWNAPYRTAGICPARRVRRASFLPREERNSAVTVISFLTAFSLLAPTEGDARRDRSPVHRQ